MIKFFQLLLFFSVINLSAQTTNLNWFDYVDDYLNNIDSTDESEGGLNNRMKKDIAYYSPRLAGVNGDFSIANKALTDYARAHSHSEFNTSSVVTNKNSSIPEKGCFNFAVQPEFLEKEWKELGPFGDNTLPHHGQIHNIDYSPNFTTDNTMYACSQYGGLWKSENRGNSWELLNKSRKLPFAGIGDVEIHPNDPQIIFASTGKIGMKKRYTHSHSEGNNLFTSGIFRSTNGGNDWEEIMDSNFWNSFETGGNIKKMLIDPENPNTMYLATSEGVWRSTNINQPLPSWFKITNFSSENNDFKGIAIDYSDPNYLYFSGNRLLRLNKNTLGTQSINYPSLGGTSSYTITSNIATSSLASNYVYCYEVAKREIAGGLESIMRISSYDNSTAIFDVKQIHTENSVNQTNILHPPPVDYFDRPQAISSGRIEIAVSPTDPNLVYYGQTILYRSVNFLSPGYSLLNPVMNIQQIGGYAQGITSNNLHGDIQAISFTPDNTGVFVGTDGGISYRQDLYAVYDNWLTQHQGINNSLIHDFDDSEIDDNITFIGTQDNACFSKLGTTNWKNFGGGDGYNVWMDDKHHKTAYYTQGPALFGMNFNSILGYYVYNGAELQRMLNVAYPELSSPISTSPMQNHPKTGEMIFTMKEGIFKKDKPIAEYTDTPNDVWSVFSSKNDIGFGQSQNNNNKMQLYKSQISEANPDYIYATTRQSNPFGSADSWGPFFFRKKPNSNWEDISIFYNIAVGVPFPFQTGSGDLHFPISGITISPYNPEHIWVSISGYNNGLKVLKSTDAGNSFTNADPDGCLPNLPLNDIVYQEGTNDVLYVATDNGVYTNNGSDKWFRYGDIPNVRVNKLKINKCSGTMKASTWGRGLWEIDLLPSNGKIANYYSLQSNNETWDEDKAMTQNISVGSNKTLTIDGMTLYMPKNGRIIVHKNGKLILRNGARITNGCGEMWQGITVAGDSGNDQPTYINNTLSSNLNNQGVLIMENATLEHAKEAIRFHQNHDFTNWQEKNMHNGGVVFAENSFFINNRRSAEFLRYSFKNESRFENCEFITNDDYRLEEFAPHHITMWDNKSVRVLASKFEDQRASIPVDDDRKATGIYTIDAGFIARGTCAGTVTNGECLGTLSPSEFINLKRGIHATASGALSGELQIYGNEFENCHRGVSLRGIDNTVLVHNDFVSDNGTSINGAYIEGMTGFTMTKNNFNSIEHSIYMLNSGYQGTEVYKNDIRKDNSGGHHVAIAGREDNSILEIDCNNFEDQLFDFYFAGSNDLLKDQGTNADPSANTFKNSFIGNHDGYLTSGGCTYDYYGYSNPPTGGNTVPDYGSPSYIGIYSTIPIDQFTSCPDKPLDEILVGKTGDQTTINLDGYGSTLNGLDYSNADDAEEIDDILAILIAYHQAHGEVGNIVTLLNRYNDDWHKVQKASYLTLNGNHDESNNVLNGLLANSTDQEVKDLATLYKIKNELDRNSKSWFELNDTDMNTVGTFARRMDFTPATIRAKNILMLTKDMFFEEDRLDIEQISSVATGNISTEPKMIQFPNPINGTLNLEYNMPVNGEFKVEIYNLLDNSHVYSGAMTSSLFTLDVSHWTSGFYSIVVIDNHGETIYKSSTKIKN